MDFNELVASYGAHDAEAKALAKVCDGEKEQIKSVLSKSADKKHTSGGYTVELRTSEIVTMDTELMLSIVKAYWARNYGSQACPLVATKEYVDTDALETMIYNGEVDKDLLLELDKCKSTKPKVALYCTKEKRAKTDE